MSVETVREAEAALSRPSSLAAATSACTEKGDRACVCARVHACIHAHAHAHPTRKYLNTHNKKGRKNLAFENHKGSKEKGLEARDCSPGCGVKCTGCPHCRGGSPQLWS